jgi:6-phosphofructokinase 2
MMISHLRINNFIASLDSFNSKKMKTHQIITLTVNPSLDKSTQFTGLVAEQKIRCVAPRYDAGGGGINVSKAISRLGGNSLCAFTSGGSTGTLLEELVRKEEIELKIIPTQSWTRENLVALDTNTNAQYRFCFPGALISETEKDMIIQTIQELKPYYLVLSGSLNEGLPTDFYKTIADLAKQSGSKIIVDTSGEALQKVLETGVYLIKPNIGELAKLIGVDRLEMEEVAAAAQTLIEKGSAEIVVVSLGSHGAVLVTKNQIEFLPAPNVVKKSTVGAGDSMVGGMVWALSQNKSLREVVQWGVACGSAATMNEGTQLFKLEDAKRLFEWLLDK